jgi:hypothetical protein
MHNLLDVHSTAMGMIAVTLSMVLNILLVLSAASMLIDGLGDQCSQSAASG